MTTVATDIDPVAVLAALGVEASETPQPVTGGWDTALFRFPTADGAWHALRVFRSPEQALTARREQIAIRAAGDAGIPVPRVEATGVWQDLPVVVLSWVPGATLLDALQRRPWAVTRLGREFGRMQAAIHAVPPPEELRDPAFGNIMEWARGLDPILATRLESAGLSFRSLIHVDYHPLNVMTDGERITGVLDWANAAVADPRADVARTAVLLETAPPPPGPMRLLVGTLRGLFRRAWMRGYEEAAGPVKDIAPFMVLAGFSRLRDLQWAAGRPGVWATERDVEPVRRWTARWKARAGVS